MQGDHHKARIDLLTIFLYEIANCDGYPEGKHWLRAPLIRDGCYARTPGSRSTHHSIWVKLFFRSPLSMDENTCSVIHEEMLLLIRMLCLPMVARLIPEPAQCSESRIISPLGQIYHHITHSIPSCHHPLNLLHIWGGGTSHHHSCGVV